VRLVVVNSRDPEHDLARALLAKGITGKITIIDATTGSPRTIVDIEKAALWCVGSNLNRYRFKPREAYSYSPHTGEEDLPVPSMPERPKDRLVIFVG
jgi:hypothetical protein